MQEVQEVPSEQDAEVGALLVGTCHGSALSYGNVKTGNADDVDVIGLLTAVEEYECMRREARRLIFGLTRGETSRCECASCTYFIEKSPSNALRLPEAVKLLPQAAYLFIIRDPRDAFISHKRSTEPWTQGDNGTVGGCLDRLEAYYRAYESVQGSRQLFLTRYENLHLRFDTALAEIFRFLQVPASPELMANGRRENGFIARTGRVPGDKVRSAHRRKGITGDWRNQLDSEEADWLRQSVFWRSFMEQYGYEWHAA